MKLTPKHLDTLRHMLGINDPYQRIPKPYRDYAAVNPGDHHYAELEQLGMVKKYRQAGKGGAFSEYDWFCCTKKGRLAAIKSHRTIRASRARRRYAKYLDISDCCPGLTFREFLTCPEFKEAREGA